MILTRIHSAIFVYFLAAGFAAGLETSITGMTLVDAETDSDISPLLDGSVINLATLTSPSKALNVRANTEPSPAGSVSFGYDAIADYSTDDASPYAFDGDVAGNYNDWTPTVGEHSITATSWAGPGASGTQGTTSTINFTVIDDATAPTITRLVLVDADSDLDLFDLTDGMVINLPDLTSSNFNVRAETSPVTVGSVRFGYNGNVNVRTEGAAPYAIGGDSNGNYATWAPLSALGSHTIIATPWSGTGATGSVGSTLGVTVTIIDQASMFPSVGAGNDQTLILPTNSTTFSAVATDNDPIQSYAWSQVAGPSTATLANDTTATLMASDLVEGVYTFNITVTDADSNTASDEVSVEAIVGGTGTVNVTGELKKWHKVTLVCSGPATDEKAGTNPFTDYRFNATFTHADSGKSYRVPGYYAADGDAANTSATAGNIWHVHFAPDEIGSWTYLLSFRAGPDVAIDASPTAGSSASFFDNNTDSFTIAPSDKSGRDNRAKGRLQYVGKHHLRYADSGEYFMKCGVDAPENMLAYDDFDDTPNVNGRRKSWTPHSIDYDATEAAPYTWNEGKGTALLGAINYLASEGLNAFSFLTFSLDGDDDNVFPHLLTSTAAAYQAVSNDARWASTTIHHDRFDVSKLAQWENILAYGDQKGMYLHFKTQETENEITMDNGETGRERKLYYRELIARFSHHLALNWNLGEENGSLGPVNQNTAQRKAMAQYFFDNDPYHHNLVIHNGKKPDDLLGNESKLTGYSLQTNRSNFSRVFNATKEFIDKSDNAGVPWVVACDEPGDAQHSLIPDSDVNLAGSTDPNRDNSRKNALWGQVLAGGAGLEWYFGYDHAHSDLNCENFRSRDDFWDLCRYMLNFWSISEAPFWDMTNDNSISTNSDDYCFYKVNEHYVVYLKSGGTTNLDLASTTQNFEVLWFDPRNGGVLQQGTITSITGGGSRTLGSAPSSVSSDWVILVREMGPSTVFERWIADFTSLTNSADFLPEANPDGDQLNNLGEFAFNGDPTDSADAARISASLTDTLADPNTDKELVITLAIRSGAAFTAEPNGSMVATIDGIIYRIESTLDLTNFDQTIEEITPALNEGLPLPSTGWNYRTFRIPATDGTPGSAFVRASVTKAP